MIEIMLVVIVLLVLCLGFLLFIYFKSAKNSYFLIDQTILLDYRFVGFLKKINFEIKILIPKFIIDEFEEMQQTNNLDKLEVGNRAIENLNVLRGLENIELKIYSKKFAENFDNQTKLLSIAKKNDCKLLTKNFDLYVKAKTKKIKVIDVKAVYNMFNKKIFIGDILSVYLVDKDKKMAVSYSYDGTKILVLDVPELDDNLNKKVICKALKIIKNMDENKIHAKFIRFADN